MAFTIRFDVYDGIDSVIGMLYNILIMFMITYFCNRLIMHYNHVNSIPRGYLFDFIIYNPPIIIVTAFLLSGIVISLLKDFINIITLNLTLEVIKYCTLILCMLIFVVMKKITGKYYVRYKKLENKSRTA